MRKTLLLAVASLMFAGSGLAAQPAATPPGQDPMAGWTPRKVTKEKQDRKEINALSRAMDEAHRKGDLEAAAALVDFPVFMVTDDAQGEAMAETWGRDRWMEVMKPFFGQPHQDAQMKRKPSVFLLTDSLAVMNDEVTTTMGGKKVTVRNSMLLVRTGGDWKIKSMVEGGWGDMVKQKPAAAPQPGAPAGAGTGEQPPHGERTGEPPTR